MIPSRRESRSWWGTAPPPGKRPRQWIPASAGMTTGKARCGSRHSRGSPARSVDLPALSRKEHRGSTRVPVVCSRHSRESGPRRQTAPRSRKEHRGSTLVGVACSRHSRESGNPRWNEMPWEAPCERAPVPRLFRPAAGARSPPPAGCSPLRAATARRGSGSRSSPACRARAPHARWCRRRAARCRR